MVIDKSINRSVIIIIIIIIIIIKHIYIAPILSSAKRFTILQKGLVKKCLDWLVSNINIIRLHPNRIKKNLTAPIHQFEMTKSGKFSA